MSVVKLLLGLGMSTVGLVYRRCVRFRTIVLILFCKAVLERNGVLRTIYYETLKQITSQPVTVLSIVM